jgi:hypothetical protein
VIVCFTQRPYKGTFANSFANETKIYSIANFKGKKEVLDIRSNNILVKVLIISNSSLITLPDIEEMTQ